MNIFYLSHDPETAAAEHYNKHVVKMVLEAAQLLCTAHHKCGNPNDMPYKPTHINHPSAVWVRQSKRNYRWCYEYMMALGREYTRRYGKTHLTITKCANVLSNPPINVPHGPFTQPPQCMPDEYKVEGDSVAAYWNYYEHGKSHLKDASK